MGQKIIAGIILIIIGIILSLNPVFMWKIGDSWKSKGNNEPSKTYLNILRVVGVVLAAGGILVVIL